MTSGTGHRSGRSAAAAVLLLALALELGGCASTIADLPVVGMPSGAPARPQEPGGYLPVHDVPTARDGALMEPAEQAKLQAELIAARDRQAAAAAVSNAPAAPR